MGATTFLYLYGVVFTIFPTRQGLTLSNPTGGIVAIGLVTVIALDIDNFKRINDIEGHVAGDEHLISRAAFWRKMAPANAVLARLGGDEFAPCIADRANGTPSKSDQFVADVQLQTPGTSIGTASHNGESADTASLYAAADANLYAAKNKRITDA